MPEKNASGTLGTSAQKLAGGVHAAGDHAVAHAGHMAQIKTPDLGGINNTIEAVLYCKGKGMGA